MIGNDVVDLAVAAEQSNWQRKGFLDKLFSNEEKEIIHSSSSPEKMVWLLWSMKEAAYKIYNRHTAYRGFIPLSLQCRIIQKGSTYVGTVSLNGIIYHTHSVSNETMVHTIATNNKEDIKKVYEPVNPEIIKDASGIPYRADGSTIRPVSISHHGRFHKIVTIG